MTIVEIILPIACFGLSGAIWILADRIAVLKLQVRQLNIWTHRTSEVLEESRLFMRDLAEKIHGANKNDNS